MANKKKTKAASVQAESQRDDRVQFRDQQLATLIDQHAVKEGLTRNQAARALVAKALGVETLKFRKVGS